MGEKGEVHERVPLQSAVVETSPDSQPEASLQEVKVADEADSRPSTSDRSMPTINWGEKRMSPHDLEVSSLFPPICKYIHTWCHDYVDTW